MFLNNKLYDVLKWVVLMVLPGLATLYYALSSVWGLPYTEQIVGSIVAVNVFLGSLLGLSTYKYNKAQDEDGYIRATSMNEGSEDTQSPWFLSDKVYNITKWVTMIVLPASAALYFALSKLWGFPYGAEVVATITAVTTFSGLMLGVSTRKYKSN